MKKKITLIVILCLLLVCETLIGIFWDPFLDWLPIDQSRWDVLDNGGRCYLDENGDPLAGWQQIGSDVYYFDPVTYAMQIRWLELDGGRYRLSDEGILLTGWQQIGGQRYYLGTDGRMHTGWQDVAGSRYYLNSVGAMLSGWQQIDGAVYYLGSDGALRTGWQEIDGSSYYLGTDGTLHTGWQQIGEAVYYLGSDGALRTGWQEIGGSSYYLGTDGILHTGWQQIDGGHYRFEEDGRLSHDFAKTASYEPGFVNIDGWLYYVQEDGSYLKDGKVGDLYFGADYRFTTGDPDLDGYIAKLLDGFIKENPGKDRLGLLRVAYDHCVTGGYSYLRRNIYDKGHTGWEIEDAKIMFESSRGNCYNFAAIFWALARGLGYEAYALAGNCTKTVQPHGWVVIEIDGADYFFDPEWHYDYIHDGREVKDMFMISMKAASWWYYDWIPIEKGN